MKKKRPYFTFTAKQLDDLFQKNLKNAEELNKLDYELSFRKTKIAKDLQEAVTIHIDKISSKTPALVEEKVEEIQQKSLLDIVNVEVEEFKTLELETIQQPTLIDIAREVVNEEKPQLEIEKPLEQKETAESVSEIYCQEIDKLQKNINKRINYLIDDTEKIRSKKSSGLVVGGTLIATFIGIAALMGTFSEIVSGRTDTFTAVMYIIGLLGVSVGAWMVYRERTKETDLGFIEQEIRLLEHSYKDLELLRRHQYPFKIKTSVTLLSNK